MKITQFRHKNHFQCCPFQFPSAVRFSGVRDHFNSVLSNSVQSATTSIQCCQEPLPDSTLAARQAPTAGRINHQSFPGIIQHVCRYIFMLRNFANLQFLNNSFPEVIIVRFIVRTCALRL